jgi:predicted nucleotidyltransferase
MTRAVADKASLLKFLHANGEAIRGYGIKRIGIFGSFQRDEKIHKTSDVDFIIEFEEDQHTFRNLMDLGYFLEDHLGRKVELITPDSLREWNRDAILSRVENVSIRLTLKR